MRVEGLETLDRATLYRTSAFTSDGGNVFPGGTRGLVFYSLEKIVW